MDRTRETSQDLLEEVKSLIENHKYFELRELLEEYHIIDIFDIMESLEDEDMQIKLFEVLPSDMAASILEESGVEFFSNMISKLEIEHAKNILECMSLGDMADILNELEEDERLKIIDYLNPEDAAAVKELLFYEDDTAGGTMTKGYISINKHMTALEAIEHMREEAEDAETIYYIYVVDDDGKLVGVLSLRELIVARNDSIIEDLMIENLVSVYDYEDREEAVRLVSKYNLVAIPVIDKENKLRGIIKVDDIIDVMEEEANEDMYKLAGSSEHEMDVAEDEKSTLLQQITSSLRGRLPWLILSLAGGVVASLILTKFEVIGDSKFVQLLFFLPLIIGMGGNTGSQASSVTVITLSNRDVERKDIIKEFCVGLIGGVICSLISAILIYLMYRDMDVTLIVSITLLLNMVIGAIVGVLMPLFIRKIDSDPAIISTPVISMFLDIIGICIYYGTAILMLKLI
ncbi:magnesium transporter [Peptacetobacter hominis]|uniref:Magnesium transporter MgtE n=1 Tax=Peptacetobacter hominis TaxID=2743610 RepID=A0A544QYE9_9FIRM|nr:magnesium transporter [Peptacetobacter hominis]TQQ85736.1 magnesium transporter [Peptacetobacter hominis]